MLVIHINLNNILNGEHNVVSAALLSGKKGGLYKLSK